MDCRSDCGACCIAPSISSPIPGMPNGKPANTRCIHWMNGCAAACFIRRCGRKCAAACSRAATCATITAIRR